MESIRASLIFSFIEQYGNLIANTVIVIFLAHLLTPEQTGLYSVAAGLVNIAQALREFGASAYILQEKELTREKVASATGVCLLIACVLALIFLLCAEPVARFYGNAQLASIVRVLCVNFVLVAYSSIGVAQLRRDMRFRASAYISLTAITTNGAISIVLASLSFGAISLAWGSLAGVAVTVTGNALSLGSRGFVRPSLRHWRDQAHFGVFSTGSSLLAITAERTPDLVVARLVSLAGAGLFSRGNGLITLFRTAITSAVDPVIRASLASIHRNKGDLGTPLLATFSHLSAVAWPALAVLGLLAHPIIVTMFGQKWEGSVSVAQILCVGAAISLIGNICQHCLFAIGAVRANFLIQALSVPTFIAGVAYGALHSLNGAAVGAAVSTVLLTGISLVMLRRHVGMKWQAVARSVFPGLLVAIATALPPLAVSLTLGLDGQRYEILHALLAGIGAAIAWLAALYLLRHPLRHELRGAEDWVKRRTQRIFG